MQLAIQIKLSGSWGASSKFQVLSRSTYLPEMNPIMEHVLLENSNSYCYTTISKCTRIAEPNRKRFLSYTWDLLKSFLEFKIGRVMAFLKAKDNQFYVKLSRRLSCNGSSVDMYVLYSFTKILIIVIYICIFLFSEILSCKFENA